MSERWLPIPGLETYEVSDFGRIRRASTQRIRVTPLDRKGYPRVVLVQDGHPVSWAVHRAMLAAFQPRPDWRSMHVNHKDGQRWNNVLSNLEWCTNAYNRLHSYRVLKRPNPMAGRLGELHHSARAVVGRNPQTGEERRFPAISSVEQDGFKAPGVCSCLSGRQHSHRGWEWRYA